MTVNKLGPLVTPQNEGDTPKNMAEPAPFLLTIIIFCVSCAVYFNALSNGFVYDDRFQVLENRWIQDVRYIPEIFSTNVWAFRAGISNHYRPIMHLIYMMNFHVFGYRSWGFHFVNILFHAMISVFVFLITSALLRESASNLPPPPSAKRGIAGLVSPPFVAALLFAVHPIHTEAVAWVGGVPELSFTFFCLLSFYLYVRSEEGRASKGLYASSVISFFLAALSKETALFLPLIILVYHLLPGKKKEGAAQWIMRSSPYVMAAGFYFILRVYALGNVVPSKQHPELTCYTYAINMFPLFITYVEKFFLPLNLNAFYVFHPARSILETGAAFSFILTGIGTFFFLLFRKNRLALFGAALIVIPLIPALYIPAFGESAFAERYLYLPSFGFFLLFASVLVRINVSKPGWTPAFLFIFLILAGIYAFGTVTRTSIWKDDYTLWRDTVRKSPDGVVPHTSLGDAFLRKGRVEDAIAQYLLALSLRPDSVEAHNNLAIAYRQIGLIDKTIEHLRTVISFQPGDANAHYNLGIAYTENGAFDKGIEQLAAAVALSPADPFFREGLGRAREMRSSETQTAEKGR